MKHFRRWGAVYALAALFIGSWIGLLVAQLAVFTNEQELHGGQFTWSEFWTVFAASILENWQSEWLQLIFQAVLLLAAKHWLFQADAEDLERVERKIDELHAALGLRKSEPTEDQEPGVSDATGPSDE